jgi:rSAM/selenodomain-associated transferase 2/rSAM/selenodomain-associated transferase 1
MSFSVRDNNRYADRPVALSVIVPVLDEQPRIVALLEGLAALRTRGAEVIVVDGGSADGTREAAAQSGLADRVIGASRGRALQMNAGAAIGRGEVLLFLHADTSLPEGADHSIARALGREPSGWGRFDVRIEGRSPWLAVVSFFMNLRSRLTGIATGDQAIFVGRLLFDRVGGFPAQPLMEDIELSARLRRIRRPVCLRERVVTSGRRWERHGVLRTIGLMWRLRLAYFLGASPERLHALYYGDRATGEVATGRKAYDGAELSAVAGSLGKAELRLLVFVRAPVPGSVKTRLAAAIGPERAAALYRRMALRCIDTACSAAPGAVELWCAPDASHEFFQGLAADRGLALRVQSPGDIGERMSHALEDALRRADTALLMGSDVPSITAAQLREAAGLLRPGGDAVVCPAEDGGYGLIGLRRHDARVFAGIDWSTPAVMRQTRERFDSLGWRLAEQEGCWDVDEPADLARLAMLQGFEDCGNPARRP